MIIATQPNLIAQTVSKSLSQMTLDELRTERAHWDAVIRGADCWGASLALASNCRDGCDAWIARREREARGRDV